MSGTKKVWSFCLRSLVITLLLAGTTLASEKGTTSSVPWLRGSGDELEMRFTGEVFNEDGSPASDFHLECTLNYVFSRETTVKPVIGGNRFHLWIPVGCNKVPWSVNMEATSKDGRQGVRREIRSAEMREAAMNGLRLTMQGKSRAVVVKILHNKQPVPNATVQASTKKRGQRTAISNEQGIARIMLNEGEKLTQLMAWTKDRRIGGYSFYRRKELNPDANEHTVELVNCRQLDITVVDDQGHPVPGVDLRVQACTGPPDYDYIGTNDSCNLTTDSQGKATYAWFPDREKQQLYINVYSTKWCKGIQTPIESDKVQLTLKPLVSRKRVEGKITCPPGVNPAGFTVEMSSFQSDRGEHQTDPRLAVTDAEGRFSVEVLPDSTYVSNLSSSQWVSNIVDSIPYQSKTKTSTPIELTVSRGQEVEVLAVRGADKKPYPGISVGIVREHRFKWKENGKTQHGCTGPNCWLTTDASGRVVARVLPGGEVTIRANAPHWHETKTIKVTKDKPVRIVLHRTNGELRKITGKLVLAEGCNADLKGATIEIGTVDGDYEQRLTLKAAADGSFSFESRAGEIGFFAYTQDARAASRLVTDKLDSPLEIRMMPTMEYHGRVIDAKDQPLPGYKITASAQIETNEEYHMWTASRRYTIKKLSATTDPQGKYTLRGVPSGMEISLSATSPDKPKKAKWQDDVFLEPGENRPPQVIRIGKKSTGTPKKQSLKEQYEQKLRDCRLSGYYVLVLVYPDKSDIRNFIKEHLLDYDGNEDNAAFMQLLVKYGKDGLDPADEAFLKQRDWKLPKGDSVFLCAIDGQGKELARTVIDAKEDTAAKKAKTFVSTHAPAPVDLKKKWDKAFAEAKRSGRSVWVRVSGRYCGPCLRLTRWLDDQSELLGKDYVMLKIEGGRNLHGREVIERVTLGKHYGIPFSAVFNADGTLVINSKGNLGNIGYICGFEGKRHLRRMLMATRKVLTDKEIDTIVDSIGD